MNSANNYSDYTDQDISHKKMIMDLLAQQEPLIYKNESFKIIGACIEVHKVLGCGFLEAVYQEPLALKFERRRIPFEKEKTLQIYYKEHLLKKSYDADFVCYGKIILEIKARSELHSRDISQTLNYLKATGFRLDLLVNFGSPSLEFRRIVPQEEDFLY